MITVRADGNAVVVDFGDIVIKIPSGYSSSISGVRLGKGGVVYFFADGEEDFLSIGATVFGEEPKFIPFEYSIIFDKHSKGIQGLHELIRGIYTNG
ncbi:hypothetical protein PCCS19_21340 [Paenibacillus sp. CCS19]|uniref:hypothetical protein n=1 Tax=Paenibacillus sp. CCS19 TaxID=3158387 RepID=UPI0025687CF0|nr:hypothetical protein [Paenibacillus cellulosilyticus]GMK39080.1 hypothetical protein PCCS19_21340 [Paenibacillus cellulosilyticus]